MSADNNKSIEAGNEEDFIAQLLSQQQSGNLAEEIEDPEQEEGEAVADISPGFLFDGLEEEGAEDESAEEEVTEEDYVQPKIITILFKIVSFFLPSIAAFAIISVISYFTSNIVITASSSAAMAIAMAVYYMILLNFSKEKDNERASEILDEIAGGKLSFDIEGNQVLKSRLGILSRPIHKVIKEMSDIVAKIELSVLDIVGNSDALSYFASSMAAKTEQQEQAVIKIERSAISLNESMQEVKENGEEVYENSVESIKEADHSSEEILSLIDDMNSISEMSEKIVATMNFISEIADETNLLALNANIQAAHAGEEGKGFGVVASEIRNLAESSADATKSIFQIIERTVESIEDGVRTSERAKKALEKIVNSIKSTEKLTFDIKDSIERQTNTTKGLKQSVGDIQDLTKNINADTQNMKNAIANLAGQAQILNQLIKGFEVSSSSVRSDAIFGVD